MEKEVRYINEVRASHDDRKIEGKAIAFNSISNPICVEMRKFREKIVPEAIDENIINTSDIFFLLNHSNNRGVLARQKNGIGSLATDIREDGVYFSFEAPQTSLGDELLEYLRRGDITQCSFAFTVKDDKWERQADNSYVRTILRFDKIFDMSAVFNPAYDATEVKCARFAEIMAQEAEEAKRKMEELEKQRETELNNYFLALRNDNEKYLK